MIFIIIVFALCGAASSYLFKKTAGTLSIRKINPVSYIFYLAMLQTFLGAFLITLGFDKHYTLSRLIDKQGSIFQGVFFTLFLMLSLPLCMLLFYKIISFNPQKEYDAFLDKEVVEKEDNRVFILMSIAVIFQLILLFLLLSRIGYIPLLKLFFKNDGMDFGLERQRISKIIIGGTQYIKNIIILLGIPIINYVTLAYAIENKKLKWVALASVSSIMAIIVKTYDFSKTPLLFHFFIVFLIYSYYKRGISKKLIVICTSLGILLLVGMYALQGFNLNFLDIYNGILGRTLFTQFGILCMNFDLFPRYFSFLNGRSLSPSILSILGMDSSLHLRSGRLLMDFYGSTSVYNGTAGVMNTLFIGEAYANWGVYGLLFSIVWVAIIVGGLFALVTKIKKTPATIAFLAVLTQMLGAATQGGFMDFLYSFSFVSTILGFLFIIYLNEILMNAKKLFSKK